MVKKSLKIKSESEKIVLGIVTPEHGYRLSYFINKALNINLMAKENENKNFKKVFTYVDNERKLKFYLVSNKIESDYIIPKFKQCDFLFIVNADELGELKNKIKNQVDSIPFVQTILEIPSQLFINLKSLNFD